MLIGMIVMILSAAAVWLFFWLRNKNIKVAWYEWLISGIALLLIIGAIQYYSVTSAPNDENVPTAATMGALVLVIPALILLAVAWQLVVRRQKQKAV